MVMFNHEERGKYLKEKEKKKLNNRASRSSKRLCNYTIG